MIDSTKSSEQRTKVSEETGAPSALEPLFTPADIALMWKISQDSVRRLFRRESGVLAISRPARRGKRPYVTLRVPLSVLERVRRRLSLVT